MRRTLVLDVVGLTPRLLAHMPRLRELAAAGQERPLGTVLPAVTCSVQATFLTGRPPAEHGIVGNGWFFRDLGEVLLWRQHNALVQGPKVWHALRERHPAARVANVCWWYAMGADVDTTVTPRPAYHHDGRKDPDCWAWPPEVHDQLTERLGVFPLFTYWGPTASIQSSRWIVGATRELMGEHDLTLAYVPHLDYDLQRHGPDSAQAARAAAELDEVLRPLLDDARDRGMAVLVLSEYGITGVDQPVHVNRAPREGGLLHVHRNATGELLDTWTSRAFAVADHQVAHVYVKDERDLPAVRELVASMDGVEQVLDRAGQERVGLSHERAGDLVLVAAPRAWFTYYYWLEDRLAPDFARAVDIHRKPGYDPAELFFDPADRWVKARAAAALVRKRAGLRYSMQVVPLDSSHVRGSHGRLPDDLADGPVLLSTEPLPHPGPVAATEVHDLILHLTDPQA